MEPREGSHDADGSMEPSPPSGSGQPPRRRGASGSKRSSGAVAPARQREKRAKASHAGGSKVRFAAGGAAAADADMWLGADEMDAMSDGDMPEDFQLSDGEAAMAEEGTLGRARRRAWQRVKYLQRRAADAAAERAAAEARAVFEAAADAGRGAPPQPHTVGFRVPPACVPDLLMVHEFSQAFAELLQVPPFSLAALDAAVQPGPLLPRPTPPALAAAGTGDSPAVAAGDDGEVESPTKQAAQQQQQQQQAEQQAEPVEEAEQQAAEPQPQAEAEQPAEPMQVDGAAAALQALLQQQQPAPEQQQQQQPEVEVGGPATADQQGGVPQQAAAQQAEQAAQPVLQAVEQQWQLPPQAAGLPAALAAEQLPLLPLLPLPEADLPPLPLPQLPAQPAAESGRPRRANAGNRLRQASEDFVLLDDVPKLRRTVKEEDTPGAAALRFKVSLGGGARRSGPLQPPSQQDEHTARLQQKYGIEAEAARRLLPLDRDAAATGALLRDFCCAMLRVASGRAVPGEQPRAAKLASEENENPLPWPERVSNAVWQSPESDAEDRAVAVKLGYGDYQDLGTEERVRLLAALVRLALVSDQMQAELSSRVDALAAARRGKDGGGAGDEDSDGEAVPAAQLALAAASTQATPSASVQQQGGAGASKGGDSPTSEAATGRSGGQPQASGEVSAQAATVEEWSAWLQQRRMRLRRPLGGDLRGRRYWCFGREAGAFRVYVEDCEGQAWGWYEGEQIPKLQAWLEQATVLCEAPLLRALRSMPLPRAAGVRPRLLAGAELEPLRPDGYRTLVAPYLRGEWDGDKTGLSTPAEQRIARAVDSLLGAVPVWFKGQEALSQHQAISEALASGSAADVGRALLAAERLLGEAGRLSDEWGDVWQLPWCRAVSSCSDMRGDMLLYVAALQQHVKAAPDLLPRQAFLKYAIESQCPLFFPFPGENVVIMRSGLLRHIDRYMQLLMLQPVQQEGAVATPALQQQPGEQPGGGPTETEVDAAAGAGSSFTALLAASMQEQQQAASAAQQPVAAWPHRADGTTAKATALPAVSTQTGATPATTATGSGMDEDGEEAGESAVSRAAQPSSAAPAAAPTVQLAPRVQEGKKAALQAAWEALRQRVQTLRPVERFTVRSVAYRRHLADHADLEHSEADEAARRWPVAWLLLRPAKYGPCHQLPAQDLAIPVAINNFLPDAVIKVEGRGGYAERMRVQWQPGDRFRMFFGGQVSRKTHKRIKTGGVWYKGTVVDLLQSQPGQEAPLEEKERYDPYESLVVHWDRAQEDVTERVSPWEVEIDPEEERRRGEEARRQQQAAARAQRARTSSRRGGGDGDDGEATQAEQLAKQAERAQQMLAYHSQAGAEEESSFNEAVYGQPMQLAQLVQQLPPPALEFALPVAPLPAAATPGGGFHGAAAALVPSQPLHPGQEVPPEVLDLLRSLDPAAFVTMLTNFYRGLKGKFKIPTFAHTELDLYTVFWAVMERGGYETVTGAKLWKEICRCLPVDLTGQTSASFNMRQNYERCLLDFENYLACGQFQRDLASGCAPQSDYLTDPARTRFTIPGVDYSTPVPAARGAAVPTTSQGSDPTWGAGGRSGRSARGSSRLKQKAASAAATEVAYGGQEDLLASIAAAFGAAPALDPTAFAPPPLPVLPVVNATQGAALAQQRWALPGLAAAAAAAEEAATEAAAAAADGAAAAAAGAAFPLLLPPGAQVGPMLRALGALSVGRSVERYWPEEGGWWAAEVTAYNAATGEHQLTYNAGQEDESFEWVDLGEISNEDLRDMVPSIALPPMPMPLDAAAVATAAALAAGTDASGGCGMFGLEAQAAEPQHMSAGGFTALLAATEAPPEQQQGGFAALLAEADGPAEQQPAQHGSDAERAAGAGELPQPSQQQAAQLQAPDQQEVVQQAAPQQADQPLAPGQPEQLPAAPPEAPADEAADGATMLLQAAAMGVPTPAGEPAAALAPAGPEEP